MQGGVPLLNTMTLPPGATSTQARLVFDGVRGAIFLYENGGPVGALIGSWAISAGTDPYGNAYAQGLNIAVGSFMTNNVIVNNNGAFVYFPSLGAGNLIFSAAGNAGTDAYGNNYVGGATVYGGTSALGLLNSAPSSIQFYHSTSANPGATWVNGTSMSPNNNTGLLLNIANTPGDFELRNVNTLQSNLINLDPGMGFLTSVPLDTNLYQVGHRIVRIPATPIGSASVTYLANVPVVAGHYHWRVTSLYQGGQAAAAPVFQQGFTAGLSNVQQFARFNTVAGAVVDTTGFGSGAVGFTGPTLLNGGNQWLDLEGWGEFSSAGVINFTARCTVAGDTFTMQQSWVLIEPYI